MSAFPVPPRSPAWTDADDPLHPSNPSAAIKMDAATFLELEARINQALDDAQAYIDAQVAAAEQAGARRAIVMTLALGR